MAGPTSATIGANGSDESRLMSFVKAYDVRGLVGSQLTPDVTRAIGYAFARFLSPDARSVVVGYDMRESSPGLAAAFADGVTTAGLDVVMAGLGSTDMLYFAAGHLNMPGAMFTASHNPATYNGIKMCLAGAVPLSLDSGLALVRDEAQELLDTGWDAGKLVADRVGTVTEQDLLAQYATYLHS
ncbi:MAG TPA: phosphomannomutase/phosphoglucomutase, partial [Nakamurella sp.]